MKYDIRLSDDLWATRLLPEGIVEKWNALDGARVARDETVAVVRIEGALHDVSAPCEGRLSIAARENDLVEPGSILGSVEAVEA